MICTKCGFDNEQGSRFCENCGSPLEEAVPVVLEEPVVETYSEPVAETYAEPAEEPAAPVKEKPAKENGSFIDRLKKGDIKAIIPCAAALVVLVVLIIVLCAALKPAEYDLVKGAIYGDIYDDTAVLVNNKGKTVEVEAENIAWSSSMDRTKAAVLVELDDENTLYYYNGSKLTKVAEEVYNYSISGDGKTVVYNVESDDEGYDLYTYSGKSTLVASEVAASFSVSPDGKAVVYVGMPDDDGDRTGYLYVGGKEKEIGKNKIPFAVSDGGTYVYYEKDETAYVQKKDNDDSRQKLCDNISGYYFNEDGTQILFNDGEKTYISVNGKEKVKISGSVLRPVTVSNEQVANRFYGVSSFVGKFLYNSSEGKVVRLTKKYETNSVISNADSYMLCSDGKTIIFLKGDNLKKVNGKKSNAESEKLVDDDVSGFAASDDGKYIYYVNEDEELFVLKGKKEKRVTDDFDYASGLFDGSKLVYIVDEEAFMYNGSKSVKLSAGDEVQSVTASYYYMVVSDEDSAYFSTNGSKFTKLGDF